ncbi:hypothetical protein NADFUDRAFT_49483 [Nadsonia fulvescens var. elongata DSM 6958]|uniref:Trafficking protein particle complex subunit 11 domain-containing protein n=1 Tax=Nadsonia fulvescens var. elongata DSM 6958 TaxID=857566 RepID=A0A1E3PNM8_9ASCO|nr:hypothetical protein NADFUDRAFT_49483 [Nadsonia fulvescens var. elongata DSM 6958]
MDNYPIELITHLHPLLVVSGLTDESHHLSSTGDSTPFTPNSCGEVLSRSYPALNLPIKQNVRKLFEERSHTDKLWDELAFKASRRSVNHLLSITTAGNDYTLSAAKSHILEPRAHSMVTTAEAAYPTGDQFSPLSPLNPSSSLYPNNLINSEWISKYSRFNPATVVSFYELEKSWLEDSTKTELLDENLGKDINSLRIQLQNRNIRLIVIIVAEVASNSLHINERLSFLRKLTTLSPKTGLLLCPQLSNLIELETFIENICQMAYSQSVEFYNNISKRVRRKMSKNPTMSLVSKIPGEDSNIKKSMNSLSPLGWTVRYEYKLAVLNELKQDIDSCVKSYETVYETLVEYFDEITPNEKACWIQARALLDSIAFKIYKMYLYLSHPNVAYKKFNTHLKVMSDIKKSKGISGVSSNSNLFWTSVQYQTIALILDSSPESIVPLNQSFYGLGGFEDTILTPMDYLPRPGFLYLKSYETLKNIILEKSNPVTDDPYLNGSLLSLEAISNRCISLLHFSHSNFTKGSKQNRNLAYVELELANTYFEAQDFANALSYYRSCIDFYIKEKWNPVLDHIFNKLLECAKKVGNADLYIKYVLRCYGSKFYHEFSDKLNLNIQSLIENFPMNENATDKVIEIDELDPYVDNIFSCRYNFKIMTCPVGTGVSSQLLVEPNFSSHLRDLTLSSIEVIYDEGFAPIKILHDESLPCTNFNDLEGHLKLQKCGEDDSSVYLSSANLKFENKQSNGLKAFQLKQTTKIIGESSCQKIIFTFKFGRKDIVMSLRVPKFNPGGVFDWAMPLSASINSQCNHLVIKQIRSFNSAGMKVLPRPARIKTTLQIPPSVCSGETIIAQATIENGEDGAISLKVGAKLKRSDTGEEIPFSWCLSNSHILEVESFEAKSTNIFDFKVIVPPIAESTNSSASDANSEGMSPSSSLIIPSIAFEFLSKYYLESDNETAITDGMSVTIPIVKPFEVSLLVEPRANKKSWPSTFISTQDTNHCHTPLILRRWMLEARISFVGSSDIKIIEETLHLDEIEDARCWFVDMDNESREAISSDQNRVKTMTEIANNALLRNDGKYRSKEYLFDTSRAKNTDSRSVPIEARYSVRWCRKAPENKADSIINEFAAPILRLNLPLIEPRVICFSDNDLRTGSDFAKLSIQNQENGQNQNIHNLLGSVKPLTYYIENPTHHILTFSVTMIPSEYFAFQGPQQTSIRLLPFTRFELKYDVYLLLDPVERKNGPQLDRKSTWYRLPHLRVYDTFYQKTLSLLSADRTLRSDKKNLFLKF